MKAYVGIECDHCGHFTQVPLKDMSSTAAAVDYLTNIGWQFDGASVHCPNCSDGYDDDRPFGSGYDSLYRPTDND